ncbi:MAG: hypothetical protein Q9201_004062 [Fulgogasparrea decipioides]
MSITALPSQTVRAIGSTQVLTDSASVVKELVDNALDAHSTSVTIEISANTLDVVQVKDNGHGIPPADHALVCKRYCTSKIKDLDDLAKNGGASLGFRGEALASAVEMSGALVVSTRIAGEATGMSLKVSHNGEVENANRVSQTIGTTVRVTDFLKSLPVRRQTALKDSSKQLGKIKRTLQAYALARPSVRISLKVLKAKSDKDNWTYGPKSEASVLDAAVKVIGRKATEQCRWIVWSPPTLDGLMASITGDADPPIDPESTYKLEALAPKADGDLSAITNIGQYVSVDSRPVSCSRGTLKQIIQLFKSYFQSCSSSTTEQKISNPFLCMNLVCPPGSYDANVEPAKDDVLFTDPNNVLGLMENFFKSLYGDLKSNTKQTTNGKHPLSKSQGFNLLLAKKPPPSIVRPSISRSLREDTSILDLPHHTEVTSLNILGPEQDLNGSQVPSDEQATGASGGSCNADAAEMSQGIQSSPIHRSNDMEKAWRQSMYPDEDGDHPVDVNIVSQSQDDQEKDDMRDVRVSNPWTLAELNAPICSHKQAGHPTNSVSSNQQLLTPAKRHRDLSEDLSSPLHNPVSSLVPGLPSSAKSQDATPFDIPSSGTFSYPQKAWGNAHREADRTQYRSPSEGQRPSSSILDTWIQRPQARPRATTPDLFLPERDATTSRPPSDFVRASELPQGTPLSAIPDISQKPSRKVGTRKQQQPKVNKSSKAPVRDENRVWFDHLAPSSSRPTRLGRRGQVDASILSNTGTENDPITESSPPPQHTGLALTMDYEARKADAVAQRRALLRQQAKRQPPSTLPPSSHQTPIKISPSQISSAISSPHANRYRNAVKALRTPLASVDTAAPNVREVVEEKEVGGMMDPRDPRAYLIRTLHPKTQRINSKLLPLETVSQIGGEVVRELVQMIDTADLLSLLPVRLQGLESCAEGFEDVSAEEVGAWEVKLRDLVSGSYRRQGDGEDDGTVDIAISIDVYATLHNELEGEKRG